MDAFPDVFAEFPQIDPRFVGQRRRYSWHVGWSRSEVESSTRIVRRDVESGTRDEYHYGTDYAVEEALFVPNGSSEGEGWLVHTALNLREAATELHVLDAQDLASGPVASWRLPYAAPLGFHGTWRSL